MWAVQVALVGALLRPAVSPMAAALPPPVGVEAAVAELSTLLDSRATPDALAELLRWMLRHNDAFRLELSPTDPSANAYSHPILERLHQKVDSLAQVLLAGRLGGVL